MVKVNRFKKGFKGTRAEMIDGLKKKEIELENILDKFKETRQEYEGFEQPLNEQEMDRNFEIITKELKEIKILIKEIIGEAQKRGVIMQKASQMKRKSRETFIEKNKGDSNGFVRKNTVKEVTPLKQSAPLEKSQVDTSYLKNVQKTQGNSGEKKAAGEKKPIVREDVPLWLKEHQDSIADY